MRIEENAMDHPKFIALNAGAWRLWCEGGTYAQRHLTDGFIPSSALRGFRYFSQGALKQLLEALVPNKGPLWHKTEGGIAIHDYLDHNDTREKVLKARQDGKDRLEKWKADHAAKRGHPQRNAFQNATSDAVSLTAQNASKQNRTEQSVGKEHQPTGARSADPARRSHPLDERPVLSPESIDAANRFLAAYPVKENQKAAKNAWLRLNPDEDTIAAIFENLEARARLGWAKQARFVPFPARFLDEEMWKESYVPRDDTPAAPAGRIVPDADETDAYLRKLRSARG